MVLQFFHNVSISSSTRWKHHLHQGSFLCSCEWIKSDLTDFQFGQIIETRMVSVSLRKVPKILVYHEKQCARFWLHTGRLEKLHRTNTSGGGMLVDWERQTSIKNKSTAAKKPKQYTRNSSTIKDIQVRRTPITFYWCQKFLNFVLLNFKSVCSSFSNGRCWGSPWFL